MQEVHLLLVSVIFTVVEDCNACATYFHTQHFKYEVLSVINNSSNCMEPFIDTAELHFEGQSCRKIFAARGFCRWKCNDDCKMPSPRAIKCEAIEDDDSGGTPLDITFYCKCFANHMSKSCVTPEYTWFDVEEGHKRFCQEVRSFNRVGPASRQTQYFARPKTSSPRTINTTPNKYSSASYVVPKSSGVTVISGFLLINTNSNMLFTSSAYNNIKSIDTSTEISGENESAISATTSTGNEFFQVSTDTNATEPMTNAEIDPSGTFLLQDDNSSIFDPPSQAEYEITSNDTETLIDVVQTDQKKKRH